MINILGDLSLGDLSGIRVNESNFIPENDVILISNGKINYFKNVLNDYNNKTYKKRLCKLWKFELWIIKAGEK